MNSVYILLSLSVTFISFGFLLSIPLIKSYYTKYLTEQKLNSELETKYRVRIYELKNKVKKLKQKN